MTSTVQLNITVPNTPGNLATLTDKLRSAEVNINAITCSEGPNKTVVHLIVDDPETAKFALQAQYGVSLSDVLVFKMKNKPGAIAGISRACAAAGINIRNIYATTAGKGKEATVYVLVDDIAKAEEKMKTWQKQFGALLA
ncbi:MAG: ACT domain-containing protein [Candidatus Peribacteraceae bacterium]|nr:ACT domain-containing protein [Candidatus Peribacteraceae bacterium]